MSANEEKKVSINEVVEDISQELSVAPELDKSIEKPKKPRSEAQKNALRKAQEVRKLKALKKKELEKDYMEDSKYFKKLTPKQRKVLKDMAIENDEPETIPHKPSVPKKKVVYESDPETEEEVIVIKKKKPKKKKKQKIIYESASDSSEEDEPIVKQIQKPKKVIEEFSDEEDLDLNHSYTYQHQPLTYGSIARFL